MENKKERLEGFCSRLKEEILAGDRDEQEKQYMLERLESFAEAETNILLAGATGCGKSSTINALFSCSDAELIEVAGIGSGCRPETKNTSKYVIGNLTVWDTPGLGDGTEADAEYAKDMRELLRQVDENGNALIDLVIVIIEGGTRDYGTTYSIIRDIIAPELNGESRRILVALNQADVAMKHGRHWDYDKNEPDDILRKHLEDNLASIRERILADTGIEVSPIYYCSGYTEEDGTVVRPYNICKLLCYILGSLPEEKRLPVVIGMNEDEDAAKDNDSDWDAEAEMRELIDMMRYPVDNDGEAFIDASIDTGARWGEALLGKPGYYVGTVAGAAVGLTGAFFRGIWYLFTGK